MTLPRALCGPVWAMGRPRPPTAEIVAVRQAAALVRQSGGPMTPPQVAREIAARVVAAMLADLERTEPLQIALAALEQRVAPSPITTLATCPEIDSASEFVERRVEGVRSRHGRYLRPDEQKAERGAIAREVRSLLKLRYLRHLRV